jgi:tRNA A-37 threonylcarbamoyl transferase component Bud32
MLDDKYRIERLIATGGMGVVYLGTHIKLRKRVAIKVLNPQLSSAPMIERFHREAITASQIGHEGIAQVTDLGTSSDGELFLVMEYLEGESLASRLRSSGPLPIADACELGCAILSPLAAAHRAGIIHRDLKPDNVFLVRQSRSEMVKLLDFGISRTSGHDPEFRLTTTGLVLGTPYYMSPEQARGDSEITPAADLYAVGVILYEMLIGSVPISAENYNQLMYRVMIGDYVPPRVRRPDLPEGLEHIIMHAMALEPQARPTSALDLEQALLAFCRPAFREHASGRMSAPGLPLKTPSQWSAPGSGSGVRGAGIDRTVVAGSNAAGPAGSNAAGPAGSNAAGPAGVSSEARRAADTLATGVGARDSAAPTVDDRAGSVEAAVTRRDQPPTTRSTRRSRARWVLSGLVVVVGAAAGGAAVLATRDEPGAAGPVSAAVAQPPVAGAPAPEPPAPSVGPGSASGSAIEAAAPQPASVTLRFAIEPRASAIALDGKDITGSEVVVPRDDAVHRVRITAPGYLAHDETVRFDENQRLVVQLKAATPVRGKDPRTGRRDRPERTDRPDRPDRIDSKSPYD